MNIRNFRKEINQLTSENDVLYHLLAKKYGLSDNVFYILYYLYEQENGSVSQSDLCKYWLYSKQTINSSVAIMKEKGWIDLAVMPNTCNRKSIILTEEGKSLCDRTIADVICLEESIYNNFNDGEVTAAVDFFKRYNAYLKEALK